MAIVIDANDLTSKKAKLPTKAFLVDTNIVIDFKDPFGQTSVSKHYATINAEIRQTILHLKSNHECYSTLSVANEYYKYIQVNFYKLITSRDKFNADDFKMLRSSDTNFIAGWKLQLREFQKSFRKTFQILNPPIDLLDLINTFDGQLVDFGDQTLYKYSQVDKLNNNCIFSRDKDFYNLPNDFYFITIDKNIILTAKNEGKLFSI